jgi:hypothetical protein
MVVPLCLLSSFPIEHYVYVRFERLSVLGARDPKSPRISQSLAVRNCLAGH